MQEMRCQRNDDAPVAMADGISLDPSMETLATHSRVALAVLVAGMRDPCGREAPMFKMGGCETCLARQGGTRRKPTRWRAWHASRWERVLTAVLEYKKLTKCQR